MINGLNNLNNSEINGSSLICDFFVKLAHLGPAIIHLTICIYRAW